MNERWSADCDQISIASGDVPATIAALNHSGWRPLPVHVWSALSGLQYLGAEIVFGPDFAFRFFGPAVSPVISASEKPWAAAAFSAAARAVFLSFSASLAIAFSTLFLSFLILYVS